MGAIAHDPTELARFCGAMSFDGPVDPFLVFADWLSERGDPWGEIITVQCASKADPKNKELWKRWRELEPARRALSSFDGGERRSVHWVRGFVFSAQVTFLEAAALERDLVALFTEPTAALLAKLSLDQTNLREGLAAALLREPLRSRLARVPALHLGDRHSYGITPAITAELRAAFPHATVHVIDRPPAAPDVTAVAVRPHPIDHHREFIRLQGGPRSIEDIDD